MQNDSVNKGIFHFLGDRIWPPMLLYRYENCSEYVTATTTATPTPTTSTSALTAVENKIPSVS